MRDGDAHIPLLAAREASRPIATRHRSRDQGSFRLPIPSRRLGCEDPRKSESSNAVAGLQEMRWKLLRMSRVEYRSAMGRPCGQLMGHEVAAKARNSQPIF